MMNKMIVSNLAHRPLRSCISIAAIGLEVTMILLIVGLSVGMLNDARKRQAGIGADVIVLPPSSSNMVAVTGAPAPIKIADIIRKLAHVSVVAPVVMQINTEGALEVIDGIDLSNYDALTGGFRYLDGGPFESPTDALVDDVFARSHHIKVGEKIEILNHEFRVSGIVEHGKGARKFIPMQTLQDLTGAQGKASAFYVKLDDPSNAALAVAEIKNVPGMQSYVVRSMSDYLSMMTPANTPGLSSFIRVVIGISVVIGFMVIFQAMYTAVMERTREIGILKSIGASKLYIVNVILRETVLLALGGIVTGIIFSELMRQFVLLRFWPLLEIDINVKWLINATIIAIVGALVGAIYPAFKAARKDPIEALAYE
ncbi:MAG TPA: FtsX-like permease family protein [Terriglobales bacterium]|nr:FtsX-like permease family protein [Terriglobales bacterium]